VPPRLSDVTCSNGAITFVYTCELKSQPQPFTFEHDRKKRLFFLTGPDGKTEYFRDNPAKYLMVEADPETGEMHPVLKQGRPAIVYLCREEREF
jgi:hypothetical protein